MLEIKLKQSTICINFLLRSAWNNCGFFLRVCTYLLITIPSAINFVTIKVLSNSCVQCMRYHLQQIGFAPQDLNNTKIPLE